jgi:hypothetical protein
MPVKSWTRQTDGMSVYLYILLLAHWCCRIDFRQENAIRY